MMKLFFFTLSVQRGSYKNNIVKEKKVLLDRRNALENPYKLSLEFIIFTTGNKSTLQLIIDLNACRLATEHKYYLIT